VKARLAAIRVLARVLENVLVNEPAKEGRSVKACLVNKREVSNANFDMPMHVGHG